MMLFNLAHTAWAHVHAPSLASPPPPLTCARLPAGWAVRWDIADVRECAWARGSGASADREGRESWDGHQGTDTLACNHTCALTNPLTHAHAKTMPCERTI